MGAVEHIIGGNLYHTSPSFLYGGSKIGRSHSVECGAEFFLLLCLIYSSIGSAVDDTIYLVSEHIIINSQLVGDIEFVDISIEECVLLIFCLQQLKFVA